MSETKKKTLTFEMKMNKLDEIVKKLDSEVLPLDETLTLYEEAQKLVNELSSELKDAKEKVTKYIN